MKKSGLTFNLMILLSILLKDVTCQNILVNRMYESQTGQPVFNPILNPFGFQWSRSYTNSNGDLITVGHTTVSSQGENLHLAKFDVDGQTIFDVNYNTGSNNNDYGINLLEAPNGDIIVCGATDNGGSANLMRWCFGITVPGF